MASIRSQKQIAKASSFGNKADLRQNIENLSEENDVLRKIARQLSGQIVLLRGTLNEHLS
jgi:hypothetical protein